MIVVLASLTLLSVQPRHASKGSKPAKTRAPARIRDSIFINQANEPDDHYPLTCTTKWRLDAWEFEYLPFLAFAWRRSEELESYDVL